MLTGDDLTIQLFILASAVAILGVAVTQAGWTHKWFVRSLFAAAAALAILAFYWKPIREAHPEIGPPASDIAGNSVSWFALLLIGFGVVFFLDILARTGWLEVVSKPRPETIVPPQNGKATGGPAESTKERVFVEITPKRLMDFYEKNTSLQGDQLVQNYLGKWISLTGTVENVGVSGLVFVSFNMTDYKHVLICFDKNWERRVSLLTRDQTIRVIGEIGRVSFDHVIMNHSEIVD